MFDDEKPKPKTTEFPRKLVDMSIAELRTYIEALRAEIARCETDIVKKQASKDAAASVFKS